MTTLTLFRHGQGAQTPAGDSRPCCHSAHTALGHAQAAALALQITKECSSSVHLRAQQSAEPTRQRYPQAPCQIWPVQEFTYLSPTRCAHRPPSDAPESSPTAEPIQRRLMAGAVFPATAGGFYCLQRVIAIARCHRQLRCCYLVMVSLCKPCAGADRLPRAVPETCLPRTD